MSHSCAGKKRSVRERIVELMDPGVPYKTRELAKVLDEPDRTVRWNLNRLAEDGEIRKKDHSKRDISYFLTE